MDGKRRDIPRKVDSKQKKAINYISADANIILGSQPSKYIVICNSGLALGLSQEDVVGLFSPYGAIETIVMLPDKTYCFVAFHGEPDALSAYQAVHGKCCFPKSDILIVLAFAADVPVNPVAWATLPRETPPGMIVLEEFVTLAEEEQLTKLLKWESLNEESCLKHRQVQHFGYAFRYGSNDVDDQAPLREHIPKECDVLLDRLTKRGFSKWLFLPDQLTVNRYLPGQGIPPHVDTHSAFEDPILSLSLLSDVVMDFKDVSGRKVPVFLPRRSLAIFSGESRFGWTHGITPRMHDIVCAEESKGLTLLPRAERVSYTFRRLRINKECFCSYPWLCDNQKQNLFRQQVDAIELEKLYVHDVYQEISDHFNETRHTPWPNIAEFCKTFHTGQILIDVGCGNGKYFGKHAENVSLFEIGVDSSENLLKVCSQRGVEVLSSDCLNLPFRSGIADGILCIAVVHHLASHERRRRAIQEMARVLGKGGRALIYVWARDQSSLNEMSTYLKQNRKNRHIHGSSNTSSTTKDSKILSTATASMSQCSSNDSAFPEYIGNLPLPIHVNRTNFKHSDVLVPWKLKNVGHERSDQTFYRYYHVFEADELKRLCTEVPQIQVLDTKYDQGNWSVLLRKLP